MLRINYIPSESLKKLDSYKYSCLDTSPISTYICHPFWNYIVKFCPIWVAPNLLTFLGFLSCVLHWLLSAYYDYTYKSTLLHFPTHMWLLISFLLFMAHTLDGIDGKQARRTKTSGPLGELFDHGCDSWSSVFIVSTFYSVFGDNSDGLSIPPEAMFLVLLFVFLTFHLCNWEKYNTGVMYLPWSYDLSMITFTIVYFILGLSDTKQMYSHLKYFYIFVTNGQYSLPLILVFVCFGFVLCFSCPTSIITVVNDRMSKRRNNLNNGKGDGQDVKSFSECMRPFVSFIILIVLTCGWAFLAKSNRVIAVDLRMFAYMTGTIYSNMCCKLIVAQMTGGRCEAVNVLVKPLAVVVSIVLAFDGSLPLAFELSLLYALTAMATIVHIHYAVNVVLQLCEYLKIDCFSIPSHIQSS